MEPYIDVFNRNQNILKMFIKKVLKPLCEGYDRNRKDIGLSIGMLKTRQAWNLKLWEGETVWVDHEQYDQDHEQDDKDHVQDDHDHVQYDKDHAQDDQDHEQDDQDHVQYVKDHEQDDQDHVQDD